MDLDDAHALGMPVVWPGDIADCLPRGSGIGALPFTRAEVREHWMTHALIPILPVSIADLVSHEACTPLAQQLYYRGMWWYEEPNMLELCRTPLEPRWMMLRINPIRYTRIECRSRIYEHEAPFERLLGIREALYTLLIMDACRISFGIKEKEYVILADAEPWHPHAYMLWRLTGKYLINSYSGGLDRFPHYALSEHEDIGPRYDPH